MLSTSFKSLRCARRMTNDVADELIRKGITISRRIRWAPLPLQMKASLIARFLHRQQCVVSLREVFPSDWWAHCGQQWLRRCGARKAEADVVKLCWHSSSKVTSSIPHRKLHTSWDAWQSKGLRPLQSWSVFGAAMRMVMKYAMGQWPLYTACCRRWVGTGKLRHSSRKKGVSTWDCWTVRSTRSGNDWGLPNGKKWETDVTTWEASSPLLASTSWPPPKWWTVPRFLPSNETISVSSFVAVFGHKRGSLTARERNLLCVRFVVRNLKMKSICSGGARGGKRFASRSAKQPWSLDVPPCTSKCGIFLEDPESVAWADRGRVHVHNRSVATPCQTMSCQTRDSRGKPKTTTVSLPGPTEHASATRTRGSEEQVAGYSSASTITGTAPSPCLDVSRPTTVLNC